MPFDLDDLDACEETTLEYKGKPLKLKLNLEAYSPALEKRAQADSESQGAGQYWGCILAAVIVEWDVTRKKKAVPLTVEAIRELSFPLLMFLYQEVVKKALPPQTPATN